MKKREVYEKMVLFVESDVPTYCLYRQKIMEYLNQMDAGDEAFLRKIYTLTKLHEERK